MHLGAKVLFAKQFCICRLLVVLCLLFVYSPVVDAHHHSIADAASKLADSEPNQKYNQAEEDFIRTPPGFDKPGQREQALSDSAATLKVKVVDKATGKPTACRINIIGPDGNYYEPKNLPLEPFNSDNAGCHRNGETHPPSRYFGWYFYALDEFSVDVPAGEIRIEVWKGYEYRPVVKTVSIAAKATKAVQIEIARTSDMQQHGYWSGDTHIHLNRRDEQETQTALDLLAAEDIRYGFILCMNDPGIYSGRMDLQEWPQHQGFGPNSVATREIYQIASAQEYRCKEYGHICLLMHDGLVLPGATVNPNNWPVFGKVGQLTREHGGYSFHAHGGYSKEIFADYVQQATDGVELMQMAHYRGIGLTGWYRILNIGYRFPAVAGSDFPYVRALGDCRTFVYSESTPTIADWARLASEGRSFFTSGPLLLLTVDGKHPGETIDLQKGDSRKLKIRLRVCCEVTAAEQLELIVNGKVAERWKLPSGEGNVGAWHERQIELDVNEPCWIAARAFGISATGKSDADAHTNPVYVYRDGKKPSNAADVDWLVDQLDEQIDELKPRDFPEKSQAMRFFNESRRLLLEKKK